MKKNILFLFMLLGLTFTGKAQTIGLITHTSDVYEGYTLFAPSSATTTYLVDNCGRIVNTWQSNYSPGQAVYLLENGNLLRTARVNGAFSGGGIGGRVEIYSWEGELIWGYTYANADYHQHHDVSYLPNGNVLILAWEKKSGDEAESLGRLDVGNEIWPEHIVEVQPVFGTEEGNIVWRWHAWDHLIQDVDPSKPNYGVVAEHPERIDINVANISSGMPGGGGGDWMHCNSVDYNASLDQIVINSRKFEEFWIIDHSTTIEEAAGSTGGAYGKGGDVLYRWGNPQNYGRGTEGDKRLFGQHDVHWIPAGYPDEGKIMLFNNGDGRPSGAYSSVDVVDVPVNTDGSYTVPELTPFEPTGLFWTFFTNNSFYSSNISGAHRLANGNTLSCEGDNGHFREVDYEGNLVWEYINPVGPGGFPITQGQFANGNSSFRAYKYGVDYAAFINKDLNPSEPIEINPLDNSACVALGINDEKIKTNDNRITVFPNLVQNSLGINIIEEATIVVLDVHGKIYLQQPMSRGYSAIDVSQWPAGMYLIKTNKQTVVKWVKAK